MAKALRSTDLISEANLRTWKFFIDFGQKKKIALKQSYVFINRTHEWNLRTTVCRFKFLKRRFLRWVNLLEL